MIARDLDMGGIERDVSKFARHLHRHGVVPHVASFRGGGRAWNEIALAGVPVTDLAIASLRSRSALAAANRLKRFVHDCRIDVVHAFDAPADLFSVPFARAMRLPVVASNLWLRSMLPRRMRLSLALTDRMATAVFVNCRAVADELTNEWHVPRRKIYVCHNGYEPDQFNPRDRRRPRELADASIVVGTVAVLREEKNLALLVDAFADLLVTEPLARLVIVGSGALRVSLVSRAEQLRIERACMFVEATPTPADWMRAIDVFVLPSRTEAFSNALLEAMACGCCPVGSRVGGTPELIEDGVHGFLFAPGSRQELASVLERLARDPTRRRCMADAAAAFARDHLTIDIAAARLASIYRTVLDRRPASRGS